MRPVVIEADARTLISVCDRSGIILQPWSEAGYRCIAIDLAPPAETFPAGVQHVQADARLVSIRNRPLGVFAWPPCTHLANVGSGAWDRKGTPALIDALSIADACLRLARRAAWWSIENPVGRLSLFWGPPDHVFNPCDFGGYLSPAGDDYTKRTCLWTGGAWRMPEPRPVPPTYSLVQAVSNQGRRSETPRGFARAVFETMRAIEPLSSTEPLRAPEPIDRTLPLFPTADALRSRVAFRTSESSRPGARPVPPAALGCEWCGSVFRRGRVDQRYCRARCRIAAHRARQGHSKVLLTRGATDAAGVMP